MEEVKAGSVAATAPCIEGVQIHAAVDVDGQGAPTSHWVSAPQYFPKNWPYGAARKPLRNKETLASQRCRLAGPALGLQFEG